MDKRKTIMLLVTYNCNLRCNYCYEPKERNLRMSVSKAKSIISEQIQKLEEIKCSHVEIQFMGGEPLLEFPLIKEVSEWIWNKYNQSNIEIMLFAPTNGTLLNNEMKEWFANNKHRFNLGLSFDGNISMQNLNRTFSSEKVDIDFFTDNWPSQSVKMTVSPDTVQDLYEGVKFLHEKGFKFITSDLAMGSNIKWSKDSLRVLKNEMEKLVDFYLQNKDYIPFSMIRFNLNFLSFKHKDFKSCSCGEDFVCFDYTGISYACHLFSPIALPVDKAIESKKLYDFHNHKEFTSNECRKCILLGQCNNCYGMNYICSGDIKKPSPYHCSASKIMFLSSCKYQFLLAEKDKDFMQIEKIKHIITSIS